MSVNVGDRRVCRCGRVIVAVPDRTVITLTAGIWLHTTLVGRVLCRYAVPQ